MAEGRLDRVRTRVRRFQLVLGLGFLSVVLGGVLAGALVPHLGPWAAHARSLRMVLGVQALLAHVWLLLVLPVLGYGTGRWVDVRPWGTAFGAALTGEVFVRAMDLATGTSPDVDGPWWLRALFLGAGILVTKAAVQRGRAGARWPEPPRRWDVEAQKSAYARFVAEHEHRRTEAGALPDPPCNASE